MAQRRTITTAVCIACFILGAAPLYADTVQPRAGDPIQTLNEALLERFITGKASFNQELTVEGGLGPIFNKTSCANCHNNPVGRQKRRF
jgi:hypothetical protein